MRTRRVGLLSPWLPSWPYGTNNSRLRRKSCIAGQRKVFRTLSIRDLGRIDNQLIPDFQESWPKRVTPVAFFGRHLEFLSELSFPHAAYSKDDDAAAIAQVTKRRDGTSKDQSGASLGFWGGQHHPITSVEKPCEYGYCRRKPKEHGRPCLATPWAVPPERGRCPRG